jgi:hypothetical protein
MSWIWTLDSITEDSELLSHLESGGFLQELCSPRLLSTGLARLLCPALLARLWDKVGITAVAVLTTPTLYWLSPPTLPRPPGPPLGQGRDYFSSCAHDAFSVVDVFKPPGFVIICTDPPAKKWLLLTFYLWKLMLMYLQKVKSQKTLNKKKTNFWLASCQPPTKKAGSGPGGAVLTSVLAFWIGVA